MRSFVDALCAIVDTALKQPQQFAGVCEAVLASSMLIRVRRSNTDAGLRSPATVFCSGKPDARLDALLTSAVRKDLFTRAAFVAQLTDPVTLCALVEVIERAIVDRLGESDDTRHYPTPLLRTWTLCAVDQDYAVRRRALAAMRTVALVDGCAIREACLQQLGALLLDGTLASHTSQQVQSMRTADALEEAASASLLGKRCFDVMLAIVTSDKTSMLQPFAAHEKDILVRAALAVACSPVVREFRAPRNVPSQSTTTTTPRST